MASRRLNSFLALALFSAAFAHAQIALPSEIPVDEWLRGPDRHDFPWKVKIRDPWLTFQQRHTVQVHADFRLRDLKKHGISADDLHLLLKSQIRTANGFPGKPTVLLRSSRSMGTRSIPSPRFMHALENSRSHLLRTTLAIIEEISGAVNLPCLP